MANFNASCSGNFINSLLALAEKGKQQFNFFFLFPLCPDDSECDWVDYIRGYGYEVFLFSEKESDEEKRRILFKIISEKHIDLLYNHFKLLDGICLWDRELHSKVNILYHDHMDYLAEEPINPQIKKQIKLAKRYREYDIGVIAVMKRKYRSYFLTPKRWYIPNGITFQRNVVHSLSRQECRDELGVKKDEYFCLFLGWNPYQKGLDIALKALKSVREKGYNISLGLLGFGSNPNDEQINGIIEKIGLDPRQEGVKFLGAREDMFALHRAADVFLSSGRVEAFAYAILEAISQNVPVVTSDISGTRWCLKYSKAFKYPTENYEKCAEALINAVEKRNQSSNYKDIIKKYSIDNWCEKVLNVCQKMLQ